MMQKRTNLLVAAAVFAVGSPLCIAQNAAAPATADPSYTQSQPAPIERAYPGRNHAPYGQYPGGYGPAPYGQSPEPAQATLTPGGSLSATNGPLSAMPIPGVILRVAPNSSVREVVSSNERLELRVESGLVNLNVHDPQKDILLLVDLPGGQTQMLKNGLYTFNAATNTARVLKGEALAFASSSPGAEPMKVKEYNKIEFGRDSRPHEFIPQQSVADLIPGPRSAEPDGRGFGNGDGPYGDGYYRSPYGYSAYPYYGYSPYWGFAAYPYPWWGGYPYGFYPGIGIGFGYYGGFHGFHGGFHGRRR